MAKPFTPEPIYCQIEGTYVSHCPASNPANLPLIGKYKLDNVCPTCEHKQNMDKLTEILIKAGRYERQKSSKK